MPAGGPSCGLQPSAQRAINRRHTEKPYGLYTARTSAKFPEQRAFPPMNRKPDKTVPSPPFACCTIPGPGGAEGAESRRNVLAPSG